jgi:hypothetical protein
MEATITTQQLVKTHLCGNKHIHNSRSTIKLYKISQQDPPLPLLGWLVTSNSSPVQPSTVNFCWPSRQHSRSLFRAPLGLRSKNRCAGEGQQQFSRQAGWGEQSCKTPIVVKQKCRCKSCRPQNKELLCWWGWAAIHLTWLGWGGERESDWMSESEWVRVSRVTHQ